MRTVRASWVYMRTVRASPRGILEQYEHRRGYMRTVSASPGGIGEQ